MDPQYTWATTDLFSSDEAWEAEIPKLQGMIRELKGYQGKLGESGDTLLAFFQLEDEFTRPPIPLEAMLSIKRMRIPAIRFTRK